MNVKIQETPGLKSSSPTVQTKTKDEASARTIIEKIKPAILSKQFVPHPFFRTGHAQTLAGYAWPRRFKSSSHLEDEAKLFEIEEGIRLLAHCRWHEDRRDKPTMVLVHGLEGSTSSVYMISAAEKAFRAGFNVVRLNMRNCGGTYHLTPTLYHSGMYMDFLAVINQLIETDGLSSIFLVGFSMSANMTLRLAGECAARLPKELKAVCAVSPAVDISTAIEALHKNSNWLYHRKFLKGLLSKVEIKKRLYPDLYDTTKLSQVKTIRDFDERYTAVHGGFANADDYYRRTSSLPVLKDIRKPALIVHAQDDPIIPFHPLEHPSISSNQNIILISPKHGGHVGFVSARTENGFDRFWGEHRVIEFCKLVNSQ
jgi:hypothetical protein